MKHYSHKPSYHPGLTVSSLSKPKKSNIKKQPINSEQENLEKLQFDKKGFGKSLRNSYYMMHHQNKFYQNLVKENVHHDKELEQTQKKMNLILKESKKIEKELRLLNHESNFELSKPSQQIWKNFSKEEPVKQPKPVSVSVQKIKNITKNNNLHYKNKDMHYKREIDRKLFMRDLSNNEVLRNINKDFNIEENNTLQTVMMNDFNDNQKESNKNSFNNPSQVQQVNQSLRYPTTKYLDSAQKSICLNNPNLSRLGSQQIKNSTNQQPPVKQSDNRNTIRTILQPIGKSHLAEYYYDAKGNNSHREQNVIDEAQELFDTLQIQKSSLKGTHDLANRQSKQFAHTNKNVENYLDSVLNQPQQNQFSFPTKNLNQYLKSLESTFNEHRQSKPHTTNTTKHPIPVKPTPEDPSSTAPVNANKTKVPLAHNQSIIKSKFSKTVENPNSDLHAKEALGHGVYLVRDRLKENKQQFEDIRVTITRILIPVIRTILKSLSMKK
jgi:hypothetical protein